MRRALGLVVALLLPSVVVAQPITGLYLGGSIGANFAIPMKSSDGLTKIYVNPGPLAVLDLGWGFGNGLRGELEGSYRVNGVAGISTRRVNGELLPLANVTGKFGTAAIMANLLYDIPFPRMTVPLRPYVGAGIGYAWVDVSGPTGNGFGQFRLPLYTTVNAPTEVRLGMQGVFAYQAIAGVSLPLRFLPGLEATLEYRFFGTDRVSIPISRVALGGNVVNGMTPSARVTNAFNVLDSAVLVGVRYSFGGP